MPRRELYVPTHRELTVEPPPKRGIKRSVILSCVAVAATGIAVSSGILMKSAPPSDAAAVSLDAAEADHAEARTAVHLDQRVVDSSRSDRRVSLTSLKKRALNQDSGGQTTKTEDLSSQDPRDIARAMLPEFGYSASEFSCLDELYSGESGWNVHADNPSSSAYGIPQALPGSKMSSAGADWENNAATQIRWGLGYIDDRYGSPCSAWSYKQGHGYY